MTEFDNVREALEDAIKTAEAKEIYTFNDGNKGVITTEELQELFRERLYNIADLLGMSDLYLK